MKLFHLPTQQPQLQSPSFKSAPHDFSSEKVTRERVDLGLLYSPWLPPPPGLLCSPSRHLYRPPPAPDNGPTFRVSTDRTSNGAPVTPKPSFASILIRPKGKSTFPEMQLAARQYGTKDGVPSISFTAAEYQAATQHFSHTLIAKFQFGRPPFETVKLTMLAAWKIEGRITIASNWDDRHVIIILDSAKDVNEVLTSPLRRVGHTMFRLFRWSADYNPKKESPTVTKWIRFPGLPMEMFDRAILRSIVSSFAMFIDCDEKTKELDALTYARACVELNVTETIPSSVWINLPTGKGFYQDILVEGGLRYCSKCKIHGHELSNCKKMHKPMETVEQGPAVKGNEEAKVQLNSSLIPMDTTDKNTTQEWQIVDRRRKGKKSHNKPEEQDNKASGDINPLTKDIGKEINANAGELAIVVIPEDAHSKDTNGTDGRTNSEEQEGGIIVESNNDGPIDGQDISSQQISSCGDPLFYYEPLGGMANARDIMRHITMEEIAKETVQVQQEVSSLPMEESEKGGEDHEAMHNSDDGCDQIGDHSLVPSNSIQQRTRNRKKKESRSSNRYCPKKKDNNFVYS